MLTAGMLLFTAAGRVRMTAGAPTAAMVGTTPVTATGLLAQEPTAPVSYSQSLGFSGGKLCAAPGTVASFNQGLAMLSTGQVVTDTSGPIVGYQGGLPFTATGALAVFVE